jgi:hypothetical protein
MYFYPKGNYLSIEEIAEVEDQNTYSFALPDDYKKKNEAIKVVKLIESSNSEYTAGMTLVVQSHLIETFEYSGNKFTIVPANAVYGVLVKA